MEKVPYIDPNAKYCKTCNKLSDEHYDCGRNFEIDCLRYSAEAVNERLEMDRKFYGKSLYYVNENGNKVRIDPTKIVVQEYVIENQDVKDELTAKGFVQQLYQRLKEVRERAGGSSSFGDTLYVMWDDKMCIKEKMENILFRIQKNSVQK